MLRPNLTALWRYRPRFLTVVVVAVVTAPIVLANLSSQVTGVQDATLQISPFLITVSRGWPLIWHRDIANTYWNPGVIVSQCHMARLATNAVIWLILAAAPGATCEWLLRRYRPGLRWSLRTLLATVTLAAICFAWLAASRRRAALQDPIIEATKTSDSRVIVEREGPVWLDLIGADRYRRHIVGAKFQTVVYNGGLPDEEIQEHLRRLARLRELRYLSLEVEHLTPGMADALNELRQLRMLSIYQRRGYDDSPRGDKWISHECLRAIGRMTRLENLQLREMAIGSESLAYLDGLTGLKSLRLEACINGDVPDDAQDSDYDDLPLLRRLPDLPQLMFLDLTDSEVGDRDLHHLAVLPQLKSLNIARTFVSGESLGDLARLEFLEELAIDDVYDIGAVSAAGLEKLVAVKHLKRLHIDRNIVGRFGLEGPGTLTLDNDDQIRAPADEVNAIHCALTALRNSNPGIVIDQIDYIAESSNEPFLPWESEVVAEFHRNLRPLLSADRSRFPVEELKCLRW